jgi:SAM-dependent methyltransferase
LQSYTSQKIGVRSRLSELKHLYRRHTRDVLPKVQVLVERLRDVESVVREHTGIDLRGLKMLDIGPGQKLYQMVYFARQNDVTGIDLDVIAQGANPLDYVRMARVNGPVRTVKTVARKLLGSDAKFRHEMAKLLGQDLPRRLPVLQMDATRMALADATFDFVYSFSAFEHLPEPGKVLDEIVRVLRPGGGAYISLHLYTAENGCHDPRIFSGNRDDLPLWPHLRPAHQHKVRCNAYLNKLRLGEWQDLFAQKMPGFRLVQLQYDNTRLRPLLKELRDQGELAGYTDDELLTVDLGAVWKKA